MLLNVSLHDLLANEWKLDVSKITMIFGTDANSMANVMKPDEIDQDSAVDKKMMSGVYQLMRTGSVDASHLHHAKTRVNLRNYKKDHWEINKDDEKDKELLEEQRRFVHDIGSYDNKDYGKIVWKSGYDINGKEPIYTTKVADFRGCIDYIFYYGNIDRLSYLEMPYQNDVHKQELNMSSDIECAEKMKFFPNKYYPSDHICLVNDFELRG